MVNYRRVRDAKTGKEIWTVQRPFPEHGETVMSAPPIADDKMIVDVRQ